jgi:hypothetical protein
MYVVPPLTSEGLLTLNSKIRYPSGKCDFKIHPNMAGLTPHIEGLEERTLVFLLSRSPGILPLLEICGAEISRQTDSYRIRVPESQVQVCILPKRPNHPNCWLNHNAMRT